MRTCAWAGRLIVLVVLGPALSEGAVLRTRLSSAAPGSGWTSHRRTHRPKLGHYLFTDSRRLIWKRRTKMISVWLKLVSTVFWWIVAVLLKYASFLWAVPALLKDKRWFEGLLRCIPPLARRAVSGKPAGCYSAAGGKKSHPVTECWRKIKAKFPSGLCPLTILLPCQPQQFGSVSFSFHLAQWWTVHSQHKDFSIRV